MTTYEKNRSGAGYLSDADLQIRPAKLDAYAFVGHLCFRSSG